MFGLMLAVQAYSQERHHWQPYDERFNCIGRAANYWQYNKEKEHKKIEILFGYQCQLHIGSANVPICHEQSDESNNHHTHRQALVLYIEVIVKMHESRSHGQKA